jgi:hypothetical protein
MVDALSRRTGSIGLGQTQRPMPAASGAILPRSVVPRFYLLTRMVMELSKKP